MQNLRGARVSLWIAVGMIVAAAALGILSQSPPVALITAATAVVPILFSLQCRWCAAALRRKRRAGSLSR